MYEGHEEMRLDGAQLARIDMKAASAWCGDARDLPCNRVDVGNVLQHVVREDKMEEICRQRRLNTWRDRHDHARIVVAMGLQHRVAALGCVFADFGAERVV